MLPAVPKFSVLLPTKNRPELATKAVCSVLEQGFGDFEIIVADNGDTPLAADVSWRGDARVRVCRTGGLTMCDNWQAAYDGAKGEYVVTLEDKMVLTPYGLETLNDIFSRERYDLLTFAIGTGAMPIQADRRVQSAVECPLDLEELLDAVADCRLDHYSKIAPRTLNTAFRRDYAEGVSKRVGRLFRPMSPDYSCGALLLGGGGNYGHLARALALFTPGPSLGNAYAAGGNAGKAAEGEFGGVIEDLVIKLPSQSLLFGNTLLGELLDFLEAGGIVRQRLGPREIPYWLMLVAEALVVKKMGTGRSEAAAECFNEIRGKSLTLRVQLSIYLLQRFRIGWPNRKLRMRANLREVIFALKELWIPGVL